MAITVSSDLILDVVRAADPAMAAKAEAALEVAASRKASKAAATPAFGAELASAAPVTLSDLRDRLAASPLKAEVPEAYRKFEGMVLQNFVQSMLPSDNEEMFGKGTAGEIWKGMMAEQIGGVLAMGGGIGIAERMYDQQNQNRVSPEDLAVDAVNRAANLVNEMQMMILGDLGGFSSAKSDAGQNPA